MCYLLCFPVYAAVPRKAPVARPVRNVVTFPNHRGVWIEAILDEKGLWDCPKLPVLNRVLNALYPPRAGTAGRLEAARRVAKWLKGEVCRG